MSEEDIGALLFILALEIIEIAAVKVLCWRDKHGKGY